MAQDKAEDAGGLTPAKDDNAALRCFNRRTLPIFRCVDYIRAGIRGTPKSDLPFSSISVILLGRNPT